MRKALLAALAGLLLGSTVPGPVPQATQVTFEVVNNLMVSETPESQSPCQSGRMFLVRTPGSWCTGPASTDICDRYMDSGKSREYPHPGDPPGHTPSWVGVVLGAYWPADAATAQYDILPWEQAMDSPASPNEGCVDAVQFVKGTTDFKLKGFSYFVFDLTGRRGCQVTKATLRYMVSPWYSGTAQAGTGTTHVGFYDMKHSCENLVNDEKRACFASLVNDPVNNPLAISSPIPAWDDVHYFTVDVTSSVHADLTDPGASGYVGFMVSSDDIASTPGIRSVGLGDVTLTCEFGSCQTLPPAVDAPPLTIPQLALGGGYQCVLMINNKSAAEWIGTARLRRGNDLPWDTPWTLDGASKTGSTEFDLDLTAGSTTKFLIGGDSAARPGYLEIKGDPGMDTADLLVSFFYVLSNQSAVMMDSTGTPVQGPGTDFGFNVESGAHANTGFAFAPYSFKNAFNVRASLYDATGQLLKEKTLAFAGHRAEFFTETFSDVQLPANFVGTIRIHSEEAIYLTVLRLETTTTGVFQLTSVPPQTLIELKSPAFGEGGGIPEAYTCAGGQSPPLFWTKAPAGTQSWVLLVENPDAGATETIHWALFNIPAGTRSLIPGVPPAGALQGRNSAGTNTYSGPCPAVGVQQRIVFNLYALDSSLTLSAGATAAQVRTAMEGHVLGAAQMLGLAVGSSD
jgi:Raf kinase inhibitor-like YbhB/YbcL family protein